MWSVWVVFCDCGFHSVCPLMVKDKRLMEASWWKRLSGKVGLILMGGAILSKSLIQLSIDRRSCVFSLLFDWGQTMVEVMKIMATSFKRSYACTAPFSAPTLQQVTAGPCLCQRVLVTHGQVWVSSLWGYCSILLSPGEHKFLFVLSKSLFPQSCKFWWLYGGVNGDLLQEGLCHTQVSCIQSPCPCDRPLLTHSLQETLKRSKTGLAQSLWGLLVCTGFVWALRTVLAGIRFDSKHDFTPPTILLGLLLCSWMCGIFFGGIQHTSVNGCSAASCNFGLLTENRCTCLYSPILRSDYTAQLHSSHTLAK